MRKYFLLSLLCLAVAYAQAQEIYNSSGKRGEAQYKPNATKKGFDPNKLILGGGLGFGVASGTLSFSIAPIVGYRITDRFAAGISLGYQYFRVKDGIGIYNYQTNRPEFYNLNYHLFAPGVWGRFVAWQNLFLHAEFEHNFMTYNNYYSDYQGIHKSRVADNVPCLLVGAGYRQPVGEYVSIVFMALYDVLQNIPGNQRVDNAGNSYSLSPYAGRVDFRIGFNIGF